MNTWHGIVGTVAASAALVASALGASAQQPAFPDAGGGTIYWSPATGARSIVAAGYERGYGYPVTDAVRSGT